VIAKGQKINDRYQIVKTIGEGGMANVYLAYDTILDRNVAVKVLRGDLATDEKFVRRFQREALSASSLTHPNIVEIYDVGEDNGSYYIVMEYIEGKQLKQLLKRRGKLTLTEVVDIMLQVTDGMSAAHDSFIIHRDIKPQNIMILENGLIKITDFGIAMALNSTQLTQTNSVMGSVHYLPPEQASGKGATIQSDVYSMGILMYELLTGELPFRGDNAVEIALKQIKEPIPSVREKLQNIPRSIENIIKKSTAKNVKNRYADAREMHDDLKTALSDERRDEPIFEFKYPEKDGDKAEALTKDVPKKESKVSDQTKLLDEFSKDEKKDKKKDVEIKSKEIKEEVKKENKLLLILGIIFTAMVVIVTTLVFLIPKMTTVKNVKVPDVTGLSVEDAEKKLTDAGLSLADETKDASSDSVEIGNVVKTAPLKGKTVKKGTEVLLYISVGENTYEVENLIGQSATGIKTYLEKTYELFVKIETMEDDGTHSSDEILKTEPAAGEKLRKGQTIILYTPDNSAVYPDFTKGEYTLKEIEAWCTKYGVNYGGEVYEAQQGVPAGKIIGQSIDAGEVVQKGQTLKITVSEEPDEGEVDED
jgi:serine/threonine-protein kinase